MQNFNPYSFRMTAGLIVLLTLLRMYYLAGNGAATPFQLHPSEAALWLEGGGLFSMAQAVCGDSVFCLRMPTSIIMALLAISMYPLTRKVTKSKMVAAFASLVFLTLPPISFVTQWVFIPSVLVLAVLLMVLSVWLAQWLLARMYLRIMAVIFAINFISMMVVSHVAAIVGISGHIPNPLESISRWHGAAHMVEELAADHPRAAIATDELRAAHIIAYHLRASTGEPYSIIQWPLAEKHTKETLLLTRYMEKSEIIGSGWHVEWLDTRAMEGTRFTLYRLHRE